MMYFLSRAHTLYIHACNYTLVVCILLYHSMLMDWLANPLYTQPVSSVQFILVVPYSGKFLRGPIFVDKLLSASGLLRKSDPTKNSHYTVHPRQSESTTFPLCMHSS
jgi:hypothetical protein